MDERVKEAIAAVDPAKMQSARDAFDKLVAGPVKHTHTCYCCPRTYTHVPEDGLECDDYICGGCLLLGENGVDPRMVP